MNKDDVLVDIIHNTRKDSINLVKFVLSELDTAYGGVLNWSEADAFEGIYIECNKFLKAYDKETPSLK